MKICPNCKQQMEDNLAFCVNCGAQLPAGQPVQNQAVPPVQNQAVPPVQTPPPAPNQAVPPLQTPPPTPNQAVPPQGTPYTNVPPPRNMGPVFNPYDHTAEFTAKDISDNKVICMLVYLLGAVGIIIALLASSSSPYTAFHVRQALKITVINTLVGIASVALIWTFIVPIAAAILTLVLTVVKIICFFQICSGKAVEPVIIRSITFLK